MVEIETEKPRDQKTEKRKSDVFRFRRFPVYQDAWRFRQELKELSRQCFPREEQHVLTSQLCRALDSILLNIAEGSDRYSDMDFGRFLNTSLGSVNEVVACLDGALDSGYISEILHTDFLAKAERLARQLKAFSSKVRQGSS